MASWRGGRVPTIWRRLPAQGIQPIDLVVVNLYPFAQAAAKPDLPFDALIEEIDIGGPSLVRAAAKNFQDVLVVVDPDGLRRVLDEMAQAGWRLTRVPIRPGAQGVRPHGHLRHHDRDDAGRRVGRRAEGFRREPEPAGLPHVLGMALQKVRDLRYGENPHQPAAWYAATGATGLGSARVLQGKELSFTNLLDLDAAARIVLEFDEPAVAVIKHTNPSGVATGEHLAEAYVRARDADPLSAFGGIVGLNRPLDEATARAIATTFIECVVAPAVDPGALQVLAAKPNLRVVVAEFGAFAIGRAARCRSAVDSRGDARAAPRPRRRGARAVAGLAPDGQAAGPARGHRRARRPTKSGGRCASRGACART